MSNLLVQNKNHILVIDSRLIAESLEIKHKNFLATIDKYQDRIESFFGAIAFETREFKTKQGNRSSERCAWLTEDQATFLMTLSRNSERVVQCKLELVKAFSQAKQIIKEVIPFQTTEIEKLKLELEVAKAQQGAAVAQQQLLAASQALAIINPALPALVLGKADAVLTKTEIVEKTVLVNSSGRAVASYQGISKTKLAKRYGMKKAADVVIWLKSVGKEDLLESGLTATPCQYVPIEYLTELDALWASRSGSRQILLGE
ncbi:Rha family transcriptional regulator [Myxosarcina sp. GI1]|uniref:Rha family transcriptional regulator n=1 Tax=Myxosarcina sp. GI1 TaxID=1541065 RepID=UPI00068E5D02|nr:Rha family transcriptional regulator [Myxosarcina sp. GI1]